MDVARIQELFEYNAWANRAVWECVIALDDAQLDQELPNGQQSIREQCIHLLGVEHWWPHFLATGEIDFIEHADLPTRSAVRATWDRVENEVRGYVATLTDAELSRRVSPAFWQGEMDVDVGQALMQVLHHSTDHRAQILASVRSLGGPTVEQDFLGYLHAQAMAAKSS